MKFHIKRMIVLVLRQLLKVFYVFPVRRNRILFASYEGRAYTCNPKYLFEAMCEREGDAYEYVWVLNDPLRLPERYRPKVRTVKFLSPRHIFFLMTSGTIVSNLGIEPMIPKRKRQTFINTWHGGGAYKKVAWDMNIFSASEKRYVKTMRNLRSRSTDIVLSSCEAFTEVSSRDFGIPRERFIPTGLPRNDRFFCEDKRAREQLRSSICDAYGLDASDLLVLYAPTYRGSYHAQQSVDTQACSREVVRAFSERFGRKVSILFRGHVSMDCRQLSWNESEVAVADLTRHPDMQELLDIADVLITDYSSSIWDFSFTGKPGFLFMPDLKQYGHDRGFYTPIGKWPYPYAETIPALCRLITDYDEKSAAIKIRDHQHLLRSYERGIAVCSVLDILDTRK